MDALEFFGMGIAATIGFCLGAAVMYYGALFIDREEETTRVHGATGNVEPLAMRSTQANAGEKQQWTDTSKKRKMPKHSEMTMTKRRKKRMCNFCVRPLEPKDETWEDDMRRDAELYMADLAEDEEEDT